MRAQLISCLSCKFQSVLHHIFIYFLKIHLSKGQVSLITYLSTGQIFLSRASGHRLFCTLRHFLIKLSCLQINGFCCLSPSFSVFSHYDEILDIHFFYISIHI